MKKFHIAVDQKTMGRIEQLALRTGRKQREILFASIPLGVARLEADEVCKKVDVLLPRKEKGAVFDNPGIALDYPPQKK